MTTLYIHEINDEGEAYLNDYTETTLKELKAGEFFKLKPESKGVFVKGAYDRSMKAFFADAWASNHATRVLKGNKTVYVGFTY